MIKKYFFTVILFLFSFNCFSQKTMAEYPKGNDVFKTEFMNMVHAYIDMATYVLQGEFTFIFNINEKGKADDLEIIPKFKNNEMFLDDMKYALKKVKTKWKPATKDGVAINAKYIMNITFRANSYDHD